MISSIAWVPAGVAAPVPKRYELSSAEQELVELIEKNGNIEDVEAKLKAKGESRVKLLNQPSSNELPADLRMDEYSSDEDEDGVAVGQLLVGRAMSAAEDLVSDEDEDGHEAHGPDLQGSSEEDGSESEDDLTDVPDTREYMPVDVEGLQAIGISQVGLTSAGMMADMGNDKDDDSDMEDIRISPDDAIVCVAKTEDDFATLEVHVYDRNSGSLYVHHDIPLPSFPLCLAHGRVGANGTLGNFCAVGTFSPGIEIWNLDVLNALEPSCVLGGEDTAIADELMKAAVLGGKQSRHAKPNTSSGLRPGSHKDAVMALSWNQIHKQVIASGSADRTVKLWDVTKDSSDGPAATFSHHKGKVQCVEWHPQEGTLLATGSYDKSVTLLDARSNGENVKKVRINGDCEALGWDPFHPEYLTVASDDGTLCCWDVRRFETSKPLWTFVASEFGGVSAMSYNQHVKGLLATCSIDKTVTLWDTYSEPTMSPANKPPRPCTKKDMCSGKLYTVCFYPSEPWLLGCGGSGNQLALWDLSGEAVIQQRFNGRLKDFATPNVELPSNGEELDAMLSPKGKASPDNDPEARTEKKQKDKSKGKKKVHRKGR